MKEEIRGIVHDTYRSEIGSMEIDDDLNLFQSGLIDSFALVNLVSALEERYSIRIPDSDATPDNLGSVNLATAYMERRLS